MSFIIASVVIAFLAPMALAMEVDFVPKEIFIYSLIFVLFLVPVTAYPAYCVITKKYGYSIYSVVLSSIFSTCFVSLFFVFPFNYESYIINDVVLVNDNTITLAGYIQSFKQLAGFVVTGLFAGLVFFVANYGKKES
ncbi:hypothetical protein [Psychrosphaera haliotis]|uniref:Uncharacterized protein n=1 Tax=Psychrosphaera haliotis TaxID=555083 RepID=A0A6N8F6Q5_9GAMM|nr:hypothetical protein [Psychrosphaera haliotis]MUH72043.1 hypothetical protein [Psychrosphaera haliotis]